MTADDNDGMKPPKADKAKARSIKVIDADWKEWQTAAENVGLGVSAWLRMLAKRECRKAKKDK